MATKYIIKDTILMGYSDSPYSDGVEISDAPPEFNGFTHICKRIDDKWVLEAKDLTEWNATQYQRDRLAEYPSIQELVVALYDADDKAEIDKRRAEIKKKYPKP